MKILPARLPAKRLLAFLLLSLASMLPARATPRGEFLATKHSATEANFHNDQAGLRAAIAAFNGLADDATHAAYAAVHGIEYLLTWNCWHLATRR